MSVKKAKVNTNTSVILDTQVQAFGDKYFQCIAAKPFLLAV
jgi:hypothetical protein